MPSRARVQIRRGESAGQAGRAPVCRSAQTPSESSNPRSGRAGQWGVGPEPTRSSSTCCSSGHGGFGGSVTTSRTRKNVYKCHPNRAQQTSPDYCSALPSTDPGLSACHWDLVTCPCPVTAEMCGDQHVASHPLQWEQPGKLVTSMKSPRGPGARACLL